MQTSEVEQYRLRVLMECRQRMQPYRRPKSHNSRVTLVVSYGAAAIAAPHASIQLKLRFLDFLIVVKVDITSHQPTDVPLRIGPMQKVLLNSDCPYRQATQQSLHGKKSMLNANARFIGTPDRAASNRTGIHEASSSLMVLSLCCTSTAAAALCLST
jgi:hypothetical protein